MINIYTNTTIFIETPALRHSVFLAFSYDLSFKKRHTLLYLRMEKILTPVCQIHEKKSHACMVLLLIGGVV
jgi:hypothetical protein